MRTLIDVEGDLPAFYRAELDKGRRAVTRGLREASLDIKKRWRAQIAGAGLGSKLEKTVQAQTYPKSGVSLRAAAVTFSKAPVIIDAHNRGVVIRSEDGFWLAIPVAPDVQRMRGADNKRITPARWEQITGRRLRFVYRPGRAGLLVDDGTYRDRRYSDPLTFKGRKRRGRKNRTVPIFVLVPQARLRKKLDLERDVDAVAASIDQRIVRYWT